MGLKNSLAMLCTGSTVLFSFVEGSGAASKLEALFDYPVYRSYLLCSPVLYWVVELAVK